MTNPGESFGEGPAEMGPTIEGLGDADALGLIGTLVNQANDTADVVLADQALGLADALQARGLAAGDLVLLD